MPNHLKPEAFKRLKGTLRPEREAQRLAVAQSREDLRPFVVAVCKWFMNQQLLGADYAWVGAALQQDWNGFASRLWAAHSNDFKREFERRYPNSPFPEWWSKYESE
jgi:hypothetical protein